MATDSNVRSVTNTLSGTTADTVTILQGWPAVEVTNHDTANTVWVRMDGTTAVASADGATPVLPNTSKVLKTGVNDDGQTVMSIVGNGGAYTIEGVQ